MQKRRHAGNRLFGGSDCWWAFQESETIRKGSHEPVAVKTSLAWVVSGQLKGKSCELVFGSEHSVNLATSSHIVSVNCEVTKESLKLTRKEE